MATQNLFDKVDREFIELWLSKIREPVLHLPDTANPQRVSLVCQMAVMACLEELGRLPRDRDSALDFGMHFVAKLWPIIPVGARRHLDAEAWTTLKHVSWRDPNSAWHSLQIHSARKAFQSSLEELFSEFPSLSEDDCKELAVHSPVLQALKRESEARLSYAQYLDYHFLDLFHYAQLQVQLGDLPEPLADASIENFTSRFMDKKGAFIQIMQLVDKAYPLIMAHKSRFVSPPQSSHERVFEKLVTSDPLSQVWKEISDRVKKDGNGLSEIREFVLEYTFLSSYQAAHQLMNSQEFIRASSKRGPGFRATSDFKFWVDPELPATEQVTMSLIFQVLKYYRSTFSFLDEKEAGSLLYRNPLFIYLTLLRLEGTHAIEGRTILDDGDVWDDSDW